MDKKILFSNPSLNPTEMMKKDKKSLAVEFEAILLKEMMKEAFKPLLQNKSFESRLYYESFLENISRKLAEAGGIGVSKFILENLKDDKT